MVETPDFEDAGMLEVSFVYKGEMRDIINLPPASHTVEIEVRLNIEGVKWNVVADEDQEWCMVDEYATHEGSGSFTVTVDENKTFEDREATTLYLCAGDYKAELQLKQSGNIFIMDKVLGLGMKKEGSEDVAVKVRKDSKWSISRPDWMEVDTVRVSTVADVTEYKMTVLWDENTSESRLGEVGLYIAGQDVPSAKYALWQFGDSDGYVFDTDGNICLPDKPDNANPLKIRTPSGLISDLDCPEWVQLDKIDDGDITEWLLSFAPNPSDCYRNRETQIGYFTLGASEAKSLPAIYQYSYPVHALMSPEGLVLFAEKFNAGEDVDDWMDDSDKVAVLYPIDMSSVDAQWTPIGTEEHPFNIVFDGDNHPISGLTGSLFGVCKDAGIHNVIMDDTSDICYEDDIDTDLYIGSIAQKINGTTISNCSSAATIKINSIAVQSGVKVYVGGLVGYVGQNCVIQELRNDGALDIDISKTTLDEVYIGGVAAYVEGSVGNCKCTGTISENSIAKSHYVGGLFGSLNAPLELDCSQMPVTCSLTVAGFSGGGELMVGGMIGVAKKGLELRSPKWDGTIEFKMPNGTIEERNACIGGVVGAAESSKTIVTEAKTSGSITVTVGSNSVWKVPTAVGGVVGWAADGCELSKSVNTTNVNWSTANKTSNDKGTVSTGGIIGRIDKGLALISECTNNGAIHPLHLHNNKWVSGKLLAGRTGGIIGTYGYVRLEGTYDMDFSALEPSESNKIEITDCHTCSEVLTFRGLIGGIAGYLYNATVTDCTYELEKYSKDRPNCNIGGIAGAVEKTQIKNCTVVAPLYGFAAGSCEFKAGGIAAYLYSGSSISNSKYYGNITTGNNGDKTVYYGGIVGEAQEGCSITDCSFGGSIPNVTINKDNYKDYIVGNKAVEASNCSYWNGK